MRIFKIKSIWLVNLNVSDISKEEDFIVIFLKKVTFCKIKTENLAMQNFLVIQNNKLINKKSGNVF